MSHSVTNIVPLEGTAQGTETFRLEFSDGTSQLLQSWDYDTLYAYPFLYKKFYSDLLNSGWVQTLGRLLFRHISEKSDPLKVLDVACGSGLMGVFLKEHTPVPIENLIGIDILPAAITALNRDYPNIYDDAIAIEKEVDFKALSNNSFNCLIMAGAASHMTLDEFKQYVNCIDEGGYLVFNLLLEGKDGRRTEILEWLNLDLELCEKEFYIHRNLGNGTPVQHEAFLYKKR